MDSNVASTLIGCWCGALLVLAIAWWFEHRNKRRVHDRLVRALTTPITDPSAASRAMPIIIRGPGSFDPQMAYEAQIGRAFAKLLLDDEGHVFPPVDESWRRGDDVYQVEPFESAGHLYAWLAEQRNTGGILLIPDELDFVENDGFEAKLREYMSRPLPPFDNGPAEPTFTVEVTFFIDHAADELPGSSDEPPVRRADIVMLEVREVLQNHLHERWLPFDVSVRLVD